MDKMRPWWGDSSWDVLWQFAYGQATLGEPEFSRQEPAWERVRGAAARISVWLPVLWRARVAGLPKDWRFELPTGDADGVAIAAAAIELAGQPVQLWEPFAAGDDRLQFALNSWYHDVSVLLFDVLITLLPDAIADGRAPDDDWHRHVVPAAAAQAAATLGLAFNSALFDRNATDPDVAEFVAATRERYWVEIAAWTADWALIDAAAPFYWSMSKPRLPQYNLDRAALRAAHAALSLETPP